MAFKLNPISTNILSGFATGGKQKRLTVSLCVAQRLCTYLKQRSKMVITLKSMQNEKQVEKNLQHIALYIDRVV